MRDYAIEHALDASRIRGTPRFVLAVIAYHWNDRDEVAFPGQRRIADLCGVSQSTVARSVRKLVESGDLVVSRAGHGGMSARYAIPAVDPSRADRERRRGVDPSREDRDDPLERIEGSGARVDPSRADRFDPESIRSRSALEGSELELELKNSRARAREGSTLEHDLDLPRSAFAEIGESGIAQARSRLAPPLRSDETTNGSAPS